MDQVSLDRADCASDSGAVAPAPSEDRPVTERKRPIRCRQMSEQDVTAAVALLKRGFGERDTAYWVNALAVLRARAVPRGYPRYGYVLEADGGLVGILLMIFSTLPETPGRIRCNLSSWYVEPSHQGYADLLMKAAIKRYADVVFVNVSAAPHTRPIIEANGFSRYADGAFYAVPALNRGVPGVRLRDHAGVMRARGAPHPLADLLKTHERAGCISVVCEVGDESHAFVFLRRRIANQILPSAQLVYCEDLRRFVRFAGPLGRFLLRRGLPVVTMDANGPVKGLTGRYFPGKVPKYFRGPKPPQLGDLAFTETVLFGP